jgi:hypothetical protein
MYVKHFPELSESFSQIIKPKEKVMGTPNLYIISPKYRKPPVQLEA